MNQRSSSYLFGLLVYFISVSHLPLVSASPVNVSTTAPTTIPGNETVYPSSILTSSATENSTLFASISASNTTMQFVTAYTTAALTVSQGNNSSNTTVYVSTSAANATAQLVTTYPTAAPTTSQGNETVDLSSPVSISTTENTTPDISTLASNISTATPTTTTSLQSETLYSISTTANAYEGTSTSGITSTTQCSSTTTKKPKLDCVIDDADFLDQLRKELINDEGYKEEIYNDNTGNPTFGIGHKITKNDPEYGMPLGTKVSKERIEEAFNADVKAAIESCCKLFDNFQNLPKEVQLIILNMRFNLGHSGLKKFKRFREAVNNGDWDKAADEMVDSTWYRQVPDRAKRLVDRMRKVEKNC